MKPYRKYNWPELISSFEASGLSQTAFCAQHKINPKYFSQKRSEFLSKPHNAFTKVEVNNGVDADVSMPTLVIHIGRCKVECPIDMPITAFTALVHQLA